MVPLRPKSFLYAAHVSVLLLAWTCYYVMATNEVAAFVSLGLGSSSTAHRPISSRSVHRRHHHHHRHCSSIDRSTTRLFWKSQVSRKTDGLEAVEELLETFERPSAADEQSLLFLFVSQYFAEEFSGIATKAQELLGDASSGNTVFLAVVGGGVIGGGQEFDDPFGPPAMTLLSGVLPSTARATPFSATPESVDIMLSAKKGVSHVLFADPFSDVESLIQTIGPNEDDVVIGGLSCPTISDRYPVLPSVALNGNALPKGSAVGVTLSGSVGIQAVVAQGCRPIGPTFTISAASGNILNGLDDQSALEQLQRVAQGASDEDKRLIQRGGLLCGVTAKGRNSDNSDGQPPKDFLIRQITGMLTLPGDEGKGGGAIAIGVSDLREGDQFQFHVRDAAAADNDMKVMVQRTKAARLFAGPSVVGVPVAALQVSCVARGRGLFGNPNVDLEHVQELLGSTAGTVHRNDKGESNTSPVAGFFANGEVGPVGISGFDSSSSSSSKGTHIHGFTAVIGLFCEFANVGESVTKNDSSTGASSGDQVSDEAWG